MKKQTYKQSLYVTLGIIIISTVTTIISIHSAYTYISTKNELIKEMKQSSKLSMTSLKKNITNLIAAYSENEYNKQVLNEMERRSHFAIVVEDYNMGKVLGQKSHITGRIRDSNWNIINYDVNNIEQNKQLETSFYSVKDDITSSLGQKLGVISVYVSNRSIKETLNRIITDTIIDSIIISISLILLLLTTIRLFILKPISNIVNVISNRDKDGIPVEFTTASGSSEISSLSKTMNTMIASIKDSRVLLSEQNNELKAREMQLGLQVAALQATSDGIVITDKNGIIEWVNPAYEKLTGYNTKECLMHIPKRLNSNHQDEPFYEQQWQTIMSGETWHGEFKNKRKDGTLYLEQESITPVMSDLGEIIHFVAIKRDITTLREQEEQLQRSQKMDALGKLTGGIAHDYNNMLSVVLGYAEMLQISLSDNPKLAKYASEIHHAGERGAKLTRKLLSFSRKKVTEAAQTDINELLRDSQLMLEKTLTARIELIIKLADNLWPVWVDAGDLEDTILNMSINAMHAMPDGGQLILTTANNHLNEEDANYLGLEAGDYAMLSLTDTGKGMDGATLKKIFDPFFSTKGDKGTGLGLSQVYGFVNRSKGIIKVYSEPDHGTRFALYFPRYHNGNNASETGPHAAEANLKGQETILIVDDEPGLRNLAREIISTQGYKVLCAEDGKQALSILNAEEVNLMLSDVIMPGMDGYQLATKVRERYPAVKIQLASGFSDNRHHSLVDNELHKQMLHKPFNSKMLLQRIRELLDT